MELQNKLYVQDQTLSDSTVKVKEKIIQEDKEQLNNYKGVIEDLKRLNTEATTALKNCTTDLESCDGDIKKAQTRSRMQKVWSSVKGIGLGLVVGTALGLVIANL